MPSLAFKKALATATKKITNAVRNPWEAAKYIKLDSPRLNYIYGGENGFRIGVIHRFMGPESGGKSTICTYIASQIQKKQKNSIVAYMDFERSFDPKHAQENGLLLDDDHFVYLTPDCIEDGSYILEELIRSGELGCIIFDSESMASTRTILADDLTKANFGGFAKALKDFLVRFTPLCANYDCTMLIVSQERQNMQMMSHAIVTTGGSAIRYAGSTLMRVKKVETLTQDGRDIGIHLNVRNYKNKCGIPYRQCEMDLLFKGGFDSNIEYIDFIKEFSEDERLIPLIKVGAGGTYKSEKFGISIRGRNNFINWAKQPENEAVWSEIKQMIDTILASPNILDASRNENELDETEKILMAEAKEQEQLEADGMNVLVDSSEISEDLEEKD